MDVSVRMRLNGDARELAGDPDRSLLMALRNELGLTGAKPGCGEGQCGACTVLVNGEPAHACRLSVGDVAGRSVATVEGLAAGGLTPVQRAFVEMGAMQCGYCTPGMVLAATALLWRDPDPTEAATRAAMDGNLCRCCTYPAILRAVARAAELTRAGARPAPAPAEAARGQAGVASRPARPWDLTPLPARDYFDLLGDGLVVVLPPEDRGFFANGGAWCHVSPDGTVTAFTGKVDVGQDNRTALSQLVAEELQVPFAAVRLVMGDTDVCPYDPGTFGSRSTADAGAALRATAAAARELLVARAAERWGRPPAQLEVANGHVGDGASRSVGYGELVAGVRRVETARPGAATTPPDRWRVAGGAVGSPAAAEAVTGERRFPSDVRRPGMLHGAILRPPALGARLLSADIRAAAALDGVTVVREGDLVAVAAPDVAGARQALAAVRAEWDRDPQPAADDLAAYLRSHPVAGGRGWGGALHREQGDVEASLAGAPVRLEATYTAAYIAHAPLETRAAAAEWADGRLTVWAGTQTPFAVRAEVARALGMDERDVRVRVPITGGGFGGKHAGETAVAAARLARAAGRPVTVSWSREEEFRWAYFRPAAVVDVRSGAEAGGRIVAWSFKNHNAGAPGIQPPYAIPSQRLDYQPAASPLPQGSYRALAATVNHFARESHMDEIAARVGTDPLALRLRHLEDPRLAAVFRAAAERAGWGRGGRALGIAGGMEKDGRVATCAEVHLADGGRLALDRVVVAYDCGAIVNPGNLRRQIEGAVVMGLGGALFEAVHFADGRILNASFGGYRVPRFRDVPPIEVVLLDRPDIPPAGAGETPMVAIAPAVANAIAAAGGPRIRSMPLLAEGAELGDRM